MSTEDDIVALKQATREAHEALRDLHRIQRDIDRKRTELEDAVTKSIESRINAAVKTGLEEYDASLKEAIKTGTQATYDRFDLIAAICMGEDKVSKREGKAPLDGLLRAYIASGGLTGPDLVSFVQARERH